MYKQSAISRVTSCECNQCTHCTRTSLKNYTENRIKVVNIFIG